MFRPHVVPSLTRGPADLDASRLGRRGSGEGTQRRDPRARGPRPRRGRGSPRPPGRTTSSSPSPPAGPASNSCGRPADLVRSVGSPAAAGPCCCGAIRDDISSGAGRPGREQRRRTSDVDRARDRTRAPSAPCCRDDAEHPAPCGRGLPAARPSSGRSCAGPCPRGPPSSSTSCRSRARRSCRSRTRSGRPLAQGACSWPWCWRCSANPGMVVRPNVFLDAARRRWPSWRSWSSIHNEFVVGSTYRALSASCCSSACSGCSPRGGDGRTSLCCGRTCSA